MDKLIEFAGMAEDGEQLVRSIFAPGAGDYADGMEKIASSSRLDPGMASYIRTLKPSAQKIYVLVNALGAGEYYGSNINNDFFEEAELCPPKWEGSNVKPGSKELTGYKTFYNAGVYRHHRNKDKLKSYGEIVFAIYNKRMHRVELIIEVDRAKAREMGHGGLLTILDSGAPTAISMGCRVLFDVCYICGNKSKTRADYCVHARTMMGVTLPDGRKVCVKNPDPRFFDLSFVLIGADRCGFSMTKVANAVGTGDQVDFSQVASMRRLSNRLREKRASTVKEAEILKSLPAIAEMVRPEMESRDPDLPLSALKRVSSRGSLASILASTAAGGVVLKPREYQTIVLMKLRRPEHACQMHQRRQVFSPTSAVDSSAGLGIPENYQPLIIRLLRSLVPGRTILGGEFEKRASVCVAPVINVPNTPLLEKIAAGYNGYRRSLMEELPAATETFVRRNPELLSIIFDSSLRESFSGSGKVAGVPSALLGVLPLAYLYGAHVRKSERAGEKQGAVERFVEEHPVLASSVFVGLARFGNKFSKGPEFRRFLSTL